MSEQSTYDAVFISPHFDDAVFSCGGLMSQRAGKSKLLVVNVFTNSDGAILPASVPTAERAEEEAAAAKALCFETRTLNYQDAAARHIDSSSTARLFSAPDSNELMLAASLAEALKDIVDQVGCTAVFAPLGVGWHIDHVLCHLAVSQAEIAADIYYYEDAPYSFLHGFTEHRLRQLGAGRSAAPAGRCKTLVDMWRLVRRTALAKSVPAMARPIAEVAIAQFLRGIPGRQPDYPQRSPLSEIKYDLSPYFDAKIHACEKYASQVAEFFPDLTTMRSFYREHSARFEPAAGYCERYWKLGCRSEAEAGA